MTTLLFIRGFFLIISSIVGYYIGSIWSGHPVLGAFFGCTAGGVLIVLEMSMQQVSVRGLSSMVFGLLLGVFMAKLIADILTLLPWEEFTHSVSRVILTLVFSYLGAVMALRGKDEFNIIIPYVRLKRQEIEARVILLDTSAIIDGRVADLYKINFLTGRLAVPRFVVQELQKLADSSDDIKRQKGRRGIELLRNMQKDPSMDIYIHEEDILSDAEAVDARLVHLARVMDAQIFTTDYNLSRVAGIHGVSIVNINDLGNAVKPVVFVGEDMEVLLVKEGREQDQAVAYTEDGTMIVVAAARPMIGKKVKVMVTSLLPTQGGRIIFAKLSA